MTRRVVARIRLLFVVVWWLLLFDIDFQGAKTLFDGVHDHGLSQIVVHLKNHHFIKILFYFILLNV